MGENADEQSYLLLRVVYTDAHLIQIESELNARGWRAVARAYTGSDELANGARSLFRWTRLAEGDSVVAAGANSGIGLIRLCFVTFNQAKHVECDVLLESARPILGPDVVWRFEGRVRTELGLVGDFARRLETMAIQREGEAALTIVEG